MEEVKDDDRMDGGKEEGWSLDARVHSRLGSDHGSSAAAVALHIDSLD